MSFRHKFVWTGAGILLVALAQTGSIVWAQSPVLSASAVAGSNASAAAVDTRGVQFWGLNSSGQIWSVFQDSAGGAWDAWQGPGWNSQPECFVNLAAAMMESAAGAQEKLQSNRTFMATRPKFLNVFQYRFPVPAYVSILHRVSGAILFLALPGLLAWWQCSLSSADSFDASKAFAASPLVKLLIIGLVCQK